ncbi:MBL fold metallo-hydrolase [Mucilaginibacter myungsuensis]|uniref:MBL fold metallo-hydrolase n=1 Tax=Mucilaginibacter myungsuensis TaxID=649104 RepID=A0A929L4P1_9SPHI|nr:MBL fold metallo-hydrolase [Mucilaginibacter myungsuensis]MBE9664409.1 MBL fold metallo-hydrolase [Mucilaginibacter myungsuensis]MDN3597120.1 MBL fold metallo-hydrolase [Mucilaginibacter myungsuensis]
MKYFQVAQGVWGMKLLFVNVYIIANRKSLNKGWILVDSGPQGSAGKIAAMAEAIFGKGTKPAAILLTHGHSDHSGSVKELVRRWNVPVYAHELELPYLTGRSQYPPPDPSVGNGLMSLMSVFFNRKPVDLGNMIRPIAMEQGLAELPEWKVIPTPGHSPGHVSLFFGLNRTLIAGDALATTKAESAVALFGGLKKLSGPPMYMTPDWDAAKASVQTLTDLEPRIIAAGHGPVMRGREVTEAIVELNCDFDEVAIPKSGRYADKPAEANEEGVQYVPPFAISNQFKVAGLVIGLVAGYLLARQINRYDKT